MNNIREFCEKRCLPKPLEDAFITYCRTCFGMKYEIKNDGDTTELLVNKLTQSEVEALWLQFITDLKVTLVSNN